MKQMAVAAVSAAFLLSACAGGNYGRMDSGSETFREFSSGAVKAAHRYYTTGPQSNPDAIVAVDGKYTLVTERWTPLEATPEGLRILVSQMNSNYGSQEFGLYGSVIFDDKGQAVGVWYSPVPASTVKVLGGNEIMIYPPSAVELNGVKGRGRGR